MFKGKVLFLLYNFNVLVHLNLINDIEFKINTFHRQKLDCMLSFYETYSQTNDTHPGSIIHMYFASDSQSNFLNEFLKSFGNLQQGFYNSTLIIHSNESNKTSQLNISKTKQYILFALYSRNIEEQIRSWRESLSWNALAPVFIILRGFPSYQEAEIEVERSYKILHKYDMMHGYIVLPLLSKNIVTIYGWYPYQSGICGKTVKNFEILQQCTIDTNKKVPIDIDYEQKLFKWKQLWSLKNLNQCPLKVSANIYAPYVMVNRKWEHGVFSGAEINLVKNIARKLNMTLKIYPNLLDRYSYTVDGVSAIEKPIYDG